jgi:hypothetical protein
MMRRGGPVSRLDHSSVPISRSVHPHAEGDLTLGARADASTRACRRSLTRSEQWKCVRRVRHTALDHCAIRRNLCHSCTIGHPSRGRPIVIETPHTERSSWRTSRHVSRILSPAAWAGGRSSIWACRRRQALATYPQASDGPPSNACAGAPGGSLLGLAPGGVYRATPVTRGAGGLLHHRFTLTWRCDTPGGLFSVALSRGSPRVAVSNHPALRSPDFPRRAHTRRDRPADSSAPPRVAPGTEVDHDHPGHVSPTGRRRGRCVTCR